MSLDKLTFRQALGQFATGVCVVTTVPHGKAPIGMTINSFASVSLEPALVLWSIQNNSECFADFEAADGFAINVLSSEQGALSSQYARKVEHRLEAAHFRLGKSGNPVLKGALTTFECRVWARYPGGDHQILVGEVLELDMRPTGKPLLFHKGLYGQVH